MNLQKTHKVCGDIFKKELLEGETGRSNACEIWDVLTELKDGCDNCIGENFNQMIHSIIDNWFDTYTPKDSNNPEFYVNTYFIWLYLFYERMEFLFNEIDPKQDFT